MAAEGQVQTVDVTSLDVPQLELELKQFTTMFGQLKIAQARFQSCAESVEAIRPENQGKLSDPEKVIVDIGTGYYVEKSRPEARKLYEDKVAYIIKNMEQLQETIHRKQDNLRVVCELLQVVRRSISLPAESAPA